LIDRIYDLLLNIDDDDLREKYSQIILTLLEKGYFPGLVGVPVVKSRVSNIDGERGLLTYRGYPVEELARNFTYEDVCFLLLQEDLPLPEEREELRQELLEHREIPRSVAEIVARMDRNLHPMYMLSAGVLLLESSDETAFDVDHYSQNLIKSIRLIAKFPTLIGTFIAGDPDFDSDKTFSSFAEYALYCYNPTIAGDKQWVDLFDKILILHADHTMNNSTFSARAVGSSKASIYASISSAINSLSGPLHGGANERVVAMLRDIGSPDNVEAYVNEKLHKHERIMGIGHRVYRTYDPRARFLKEEILAGIFGREDGEMVLEESLVTMYRTAQKLEQVAMERLKDKRLFPNVDFWSGLALTAMGIEPRYFTTVFALGRIMGWCSHWVEHMEVENKIYRPTQLYDGFETRHVLINPKEVS